MAVYGNIIALHFVPHSRPQSRLNIATEMVGEGTCYASKPPPPFNIHIGLIFNPHLVFTPPINIHGRIAIHIGKEHRQQTQSTYTTLRSGMDHISILKCVYTPKNNCIIGEQDVQSMRRLPF